MNLMTIIIFECPLDDNIFVKSNVYIHSFPSPYEKFVKKTYIFFDKAVTTTITDTFDRSVEKLLLFFLVFNF